MKNSFISSKLIMVKGLAVLAALLAASVSAIDEQSFLTHLAEKHNIVTLDERQIKNEVDTFKNLQRSQQLLEIKRKILQTLGGVNDVYQELGLSSVEAKTELLGILRRVQNAPEDPVEAKAVFSEIHNNLNQLIGFIPDDVMLQRYGSKPHHKPSHKPQPEWEVEPEWEPPVWKPPPVPEWNPTPEWKPKPPKPEWKPPSSEPEWKPPKPEWKPPPEPEWKPPPKPEWKPPPEPEWKPPPEPEWKPPSKPEWKPPPEPEWKPPKPEWSPPAPEPEWHPSPPKPEWKPPKPESSKWPLINVIADPEPIWSLLKIVLHPVLDAVRLVKALVSCLL